MKKSNLILIEWEDSSMAPQGWQFEKDCDFKLSICTSVGFVIEESKEKIILAPHVFFEGENRQMAGYAVIPKTAIRKRKALK